ncbi:MAG: HNH endonuclease signature motif containing protein [Actinomycetota bacterium]
MLRQLRYRDRGCVFPGCGTRSFTEAHHVVWWSKGGTTDLENLVVICSFHHRLVHEHGWRLSRAPDGEVRWFRADGERFLAGPSPGKPEPRRAASA